MAQEKQNPDPQGKAGKVQGEGDYDAARRYEEKMREHVQHHDIEKEARDAEPSNEGEARAMEQAEEKGKRRAKEEDTLLRHPENVQTSTDKPKGTQDTQDT